MSTVYEAQAHTHTHSLYIYIHTHTGKTYEHRVPDDEAQAWLDALLFTVKAAQSKPSRSIFREKYGHSAYLMMRARGADQEVNGRTVQVCVYVCAYVCVYVCERKSVYVM